MYARAQDKDFDEYEMNHIRNLNQSAPPKRSMTIGMSEIERNRIKNTVSQLDYFETETMELEQLEKQRRKQIDDANSADRKAQREKKES